MMDAQRKHIHKLVQKNFAAAATLTHPHFQSCCEESALTENVGGLTRVEANRLGYSPQDVAQIPADAYAGLGCGNPLSLAGLQAGEVVLDLGSGAGFDALLAAQKVGPLGRVIGVDMTPQMVAKAKENAIKAGMPQVEFHRGFIENLPLPDKSVDVVISNCVVNLSPDKPAVFREAWRVLRVGGRLVMADVVATAELPTHIREDMAMHSCCISGAAEINYLEFIMHRAGFSKIRIQPKAESQSFIRQWAPGSNAEDYIVAAYIQAVKA